ncbi:MAG: type II toxin-antitoxin system VapB family antitoxin [Dehalococcoidia bacterium]
MPTNLDLDDELIREAQALGCHKTKKAAVNAALADYVQYRKQLAVIDLFGQFEWDEAYDIKAIRRRSTRWFDDETGEERRYDDDR